ncbi:MAG TPA: MscL family protein [Ilumatobacteraceae bacterium]|nr:MscL family protein [Ilumatobacteraceae bacterium]
MKNFLKEFRDFISTGSMIELAVAVILAGAVGAVIKAFTEGVMMNLVAAIFGKPNFDQVARLKLNDKVTTLDDGTVQAGTYLEFGRVLTALITLLMTGFVLFLIIKAYNRMKKNQPDPGPTDTELLTEIRDELRARRV